MTKGQQPQSFMPSYKSLYSSHGQSVLVKRNDSYLNKREALKYMKADQTWWMLVPDSPLRLTWDSIILIIVFFQALMIPFQLSFGMQDAYDQFREDSLYLDIVFTAIFSWDIIVQFNTAFYAHGQIEASRWKIAKQYLKSWFALDVIATIPYDFIVLVAFDPQDTEQARSSSLYRAPRLLRIIKMSKFLVVFRLMRIIRVKRIIMNVEEFISQSTLSLLFVVIKLIGMIMFSAHWLACFFYFLGTEEAMVDGDSWLHDSGVIDMQPLEQYVTSLYWALSTMATVGYGEIVPRTYSEQLFTLWSEFLACGLFAFAVGKLGAIVSKNSMQETIYRERTVAVNAYMKRHELPLNLQFRVRRYLEYVWDHQRNAFDETEILAMLSDPLRKEIFGKINGELLNLFPLFKEMYDRLFLASLVKSFRLESYAPGDVVIEYGEMSRQLFFIVHGSMSIGYLETTTWFRILRKDCIFGEIAFFLGIPRQASAQCNNYVDLQVLPYEAFAKVLDKYPEALNKTQALKKMCLETDLTELLVKWYICQDVGHVAMKCKKTLLGYDHEEVKMQWVKSRTSNPTKPLQGFMHKDPKTNHNRMRRECHDINSVKGKNRVTVFKGSKYLNKKIGSYMEWQKAREILLEQKTTKEDDNPHLSIIYGDSESEMSRNNTPENPFPRVTRKSTFRQSLIPITPRQLSLPMTFEPNSAMIDH